MSYVICAELPPDIEVNMSGDRTRVNAMLVSERDGYIKFHAPGKFGEEKERTLALCSSLLDAGFSEFRIYHSF